MRYEKATVRKHILFRLIKYIAFSSYFLNPALNENEFIYLFITQTPEGKIKSVLAGFRVWFTNKAFWSSCAHYMSELATFWVSFSQLPALTIVAIGAILRFLYTFNCQSWLMQLSELHPILQSPNYDSSLLFWLVLGQLSELHFTFCTQSTVGKTNVAIWTKPHSISSQCPFSLYLAIVPGENKAKHLWSMNHSTKMIH